MIFLTSWRWIGGVGTHRHQFSGIRGFEFVCESARTPCLRIARRIVAAVLIHEELYDLQAGQFIKAADIAALIDFGFLPRPRHAGHTASQILGGTGD